MQKFKNWLIVAVAFATIPFIKVCIRPGPLLDDWTQVFLLPIALLLIYAIMYVVGLILGIAIISVNVTLSLIFIKKDDGLGLYNILHNRNRSYFVEILSRPLKFLLIKYWDTIRKNGTIEAFFSFIITLFIFMYLLLCWGIIKV